MIFKKKTELTLNISKMNNNSSKAMPNSREGGDQEEQVIRDVLVRTLSLICDMNLQLKNVQAARKNIKDLDNISKNEATVFLLKIISW